jgi:hypothetical protein
VFIKKIKDLAIMAVNIRLTRVRAYKSLICKAIFKTGIILESPLFTSLPLTAMLAFFAQSGILR